MTATNITLSALILSTLIAIAILFSMGRDRRSAFFSSVGYLAFLFLISGFAALIYQIVWQRTLFAAFGVNVESITVIVSLFMFGLGLGSLFGGIVSRKYPNSAPTLFLICEAGIGLFGIVSVPLINGVARLTLHGSLLQVSLAVFALLAIPTMLMGATLPILVGHLYRHYRNVGKSVGLLYCINTLGSAIACFITADLLFVYLGQQAAVFCAAACNLIVGVLVWRYSRRITGRQETSLIPAPAGPQGGDGSSARLWLVLFLAAATGYISLSQEMLWMRAVAYMTGGRPAVFAHVLGCFLIGVALGALLGDKICERYFADDRRSPLPFIGLMLIASALFYYFSISATANLLTVKLHDGPVQPDDFPWMGIISMYLDVAVVSFLLGALFPVLCHYGSTVGASVGVSVSRVYVANIVGSTAGPLLTGFVLMEFLSTDRIILYISVATALIGVFAFLQSRPRWIGIAGAVAGAGAVAMMVGLHAGLYKDLLEKLNFQIRYTPTWTYIHLVENRHGIIAVTPNYGGDMLYGGGMYDGNFNTDPVMNTNSIQRCYWISALHPAPADILEIGLASGSWTCVTADYAPVRNITVIEINPGYLDIISKYAEQAAMLRDPKVRVEIDDGRRWLNRHPDARFDLILQNTTWHWRSQITNLLSREYLELCKSHLRPGGVMYVNATGSDDVAYTMARVFKHVVFFEFDRPKNIAPRYSPTIVAASDTPFDLQPLRIRENLLNFSRGGTPIFSPDSPKQMEVLDKLSRASLHDYGPELRARNDLWFITDDNMATEYKIPTRK